MNIAVLIGWAARGVVVLLSLFNTRLLIDLVGVDGLAVHAIILSLTIWFALLNLGSPAAVQNLISKYRAEGRQYEGLKNTAYSVVVLLFLSFLPVVVLIGLVVKYWMLENYAFVNVFAVLAACLIIFLSGLGVLLNQIMYAEQRGVWPNVYPAINAIGVSVCLIVLQRLKIVNFNIVLIVFLLPTIVVFALCVVQLKAFRTWSLDRQIVREIWQHSKGFLLFATLSACTLAVDYFVMSQILKAQEIAQYNLSSRIFLTVLTVHTILLSTTWPILSELMHGNKFHEARDRLIRVLRQGLLIAAVVGTVLVVAMSRIISILSGGKVADISLAVTAGWLIYILVRVWCDTFAMGLLSVGKTGIFNRYVPFQAALSIVGQYYLGSQFGLFGIIIGLIISFLLTAAWILPVEFLKITNEK